VAQLTHSETISWFCFLSLILLGSKLITYIGRHFHLPAIMSELATGLLLGPCVLGILAPKWHKWLWPNTLHLGVALDVLSKIAVVILMFMAGTELSIKHIKKQARPTAYISTTAMVIPFVLGFLVCFLNPSWFSKTPTNSWLLSLFIGTAMSISALPVIAKTLMDLNILKHRLGRIILTSAMIEDLAGWIIFSFILSLFKQQTLKILLLNIFLMLVFTIVSLTLGQRLLNRLFVFKNAKEYILCGCLMACFLCAAFTEYLGFHAALGAFIAGMMFSYIDDTYNIVHPFLHPLINHFLAPVLFVSIGFKITRLEDFNGLLIMLILFIATVGKILGAYMGARLAQLNSKESWAIGFGLNARGAMEIILGDLALQAGLIQAPLFVALIVMAMTTSILSAPAMRYFIKNICTST